MRLLLLAAVLALQLLQPGSCQEQQNITTTAPFPLTLDPPAPTACTVPIAPVEALKPPLFDPTSPVETNTTHPHPILYSRPSAPGMPRNPPRPPINPFAASESHSPSILGPAVPPFYKAVTAGDYRMDINPFIGFAGFRKAMAMKNRYNGYGNGKYDDEPPDPLVIRDLMPYGAKTTDPIQEQAMASNQIIAGMAGIKGLRGLTLRRDDRCMVNPALDRMTRAKPIVQLDLDRILADRERIKAKEEGQIAAAEAAATGKSLDPAKSVAASSFEKMPESEKHKRIADFWNSRAEPIHTSNDQQQMQNFLAAMNTQAEQAQKARTQNPMLNLIGMDTSSQSTAQQQIAAAASAKPAPAAPKYGDIDSRSDQFTV